MIDIFGFHFKGPGSKYWGMIIDEFSIHIGLSTIVGLPSVLLIFIVLGSNYNLVSGFTIFGFFPFWLRFFIDAYVTSLILCIPLTVVTMLKFSIDFPMEEEEITEVEGKYVLMNLSNGYVGKFIRLPNEFEGKAGASYKVKYK